MSRSLPTKAGAPLRKNLSQPAPVRNFLAQSGEMVEMTPEMQMSVVFDLSMIRSGYKNLFVAAHLGVGEPHVSKWRNVDAREVPSLAQITALGPDFLRIYNREQAKFYGFDKKALVELLQLAGELAQAAS